MAASQGGLRFGSGLFSARARRSLALPARSCAGRLTYPFVYMLKGIGLGGSNATAFEQIGYSFADIVAKAVFGIVIWRIAHEKTMVMEQEGLLK